MRSALALFCLGIYAISFMPRLPDIGSGIAALLTILLLFALTAIWWRAPASTWKTFACLLLCLSLGAGRAVYHGLIITESRLPAALEGRDIWVEGQVEGLPEGASAGSVTYRSGGQQTRFQLRVEHSCLRLLPENCEESAPVLTGHLIALNAYGSVTGKLDCDAAAVPQSGETWRLRVRLNRVHGFANPGGYDFEAAQAQQGIVARGYVRATTFNQRLRPADWSIDQWRIQIREQVYATGTLQFPGLLTALTTGLRSGISNGQWDTLTATGTNHLMVISGLHVGLVATACYWIINLLARMSASMLERIPAQRLAALAAVLGAWLYSAMAGFSLPTQRAVIMVSMLMLAQLLGRQVLPSYRILLAMAAVLGVDPLAVTQAGFWLSFVAVGALLMLFAGPQQLGPPASAQSNRLRWGQHACLVWLKPQFAVSIALLVPLLLWTGQVSWVSPLVNLLAIPVVSLWVVPLALVGIVLLPVSSAAAQWALVGADTGLVILMQGLESVARWQPLWQGPVTSPLTVLCVSVGCLLLLLPRGLLPRWPALLLMLPLLAPPRPDRPGPGELWLQMLDVGQGLAVLLQTSHHSMLFDTGTALGPDYDAGRAAILPALKQAGIQQLDVLIISHWHQDHYGGLSSILGSVRVTQLVSSAPERFRDFNGVSNALMKPCGSDDYWQWDSVEFRVLHPDPTERGGGGDNPNNTSCVVHVSAGSHALLLTGDIEAPVERRLLRQQGDLLAADVLLAAHHGSDSSSTEAWLRQVSPDWLLVSAGYRNRFGHPDPAVLQRARSLDIKVLRTDHHGAVTMMLGGPGEAQLKALHRRDQRRFWHNNPSGEYGKVAGKSAGD